MTAALDPRSLPPEKLRVMTPVVYGFQFAANFLYLGLGLFLIPKVAGLGAPGGPDPGLLRVVLGGAALSLLAAAAVVRRVQLSPDRWRTHFAGEENAPWVALHRLTITTGSMLDGVGMFGLILGILTRRVVDLVPFVAVAAVAMLACWPRPSLIETMRLRVQGALAGERDLPRRDADEARRIPPDS